MMMMIEFVCKLIVLDHSYSHQERDYTSIVGDKLNCLCHPYIASLRTLIRANVEDKFNCHETSCSVIFLMNILFYGISLTVL